MLPTLIVCAYLAGVLYIGIFAFRHRRGTENAEQFFLAGRAVGPYVFLTSLFGTHMTAFAVLGSSAHAFNNGIVTFGLMATAAGIVTPLCLLLAGTRIWALGRRHGFITPVQMFRDRWECNHIGTVIFVVQAALLVPYIVIGVMGGGTTMEAVSQGRIPYWAGGAMVAAVVMGYVFFGGMKGTALVNAVQTTMFLLLGTVAFVVIGYGMGGFRETIAGMLSTPSEAALLTRERVPPLFFFSYMFIPLSAIAFPHIGIFCLTAKRVTHFKHTVIAYPLCLMAIWLPSTFLGVVANRAADVPAIERKIEARQILASSGAALEPEQRRALRHDADGEDVVIQLLHFYAPVWLAGLLSAGIMAAVMSSDSQILALSTMFTEDVFAHYGGGRRFGETAQVEMGRSFVVLVTLVAYAIAMRAPADIFSLATQYGFSGYAALAPLVFAALFWKRSTKWGALAVTLWSMGAVLGIAAFQALVPVPGAGQSGAFWSIGGVEILARTRGGTAVLGLAPVLPMVIVSVGLMWVVSKVTRPASAETIARYDI